MLLRINFMPARRNAQTRSGPGFATEPRAPPFRVLGGKGGIPPKPTQTFSLFHRLTNYSLQLLRRRPPRIAQINLMVLAAEFLPGRMDEVMYALDGWSLAGERPQVKNLRRWAF